MEKIRAVLRQAETEDEYLDERYIEYVPRVGEEIWLYLRDGDVDYSPSEWKITRIIHNWQNGLDGKPSPLSVEIVVERVSP